MMPLKTGPLGAAPGPAETDAPRPAWRDRLSARIPSLIRIHAVRSQPLAPLPGDPARARHAMGGTWIYGGAILRAGDTPPWTHPVQGEGWRDALHGFAWLDDLAALGNAEARRFAQGLVNDWAGRFGRGHGAGWRPGLTGLRQMRLISHSVFLLNGLLEDENRRLMRLLERQASFLARRHRIARPGLRQISAACGWVHSAICLDGAEVFESAALGALAKACHTGLGAGDALASRNPEHLLQIFSLLTWTANLLADRGRPRDPSLDTYIARLAAALRALRMSDGSLPRLHGGGRGQPGLLDNALRRSGLRPARAQGPIMGIARIDASGASVALDAAPPPIGADQGHAGTLGLELSCGHQPVIVHCGSGAHLGADWRKFGRTTAAHSTLELLGYASSRLPVGGAAEAALIDGPGEVALQHRVSGSASGLALSHDGWRASHGLTHLRMVQFEQDGRLLTGEDALAAMDGADRERLARITRVRGGRALDFAVRFHLHPDARPTLDMGGKAVSVTLPDGDVWVFRHSGEGALTLEPSVYLDRRHVQARASRQIVLRGRVAGLGGTVSWQFSRPVLAPSRRRAFAKAAGPGDVLSLAPSSRIGQGNGASATAQEEPLSLRDRV
ncbi:MAG: heparinase II/III family protein [Pseudomonadota bacterium]